MFACVCVQDLASGESSPVFVETDPVLCLEYDPQSNSLWTGTTSSSIHKWFATPASDGSRSATGRRRSSSQSHVLGSSPPLSSRVSANHHQKGAKSPELQVSQTMPAVTLRGMPSIKRYYLLKDRRHVLTLTSDGDIEIQDITTGKRHVLPEYERGTKFEDAEKDFEDEKLSVPSWCTLDARRGRLAVKLELKGCFGTDIYAGDLEGNDPLDERKVNIGEHILCALLGHWNLRADELDDDDEEHAKGEGENGSQEAATTTRRDSASETNASSSGGGGGNNTADGAGTEIVTAAARTLFSFEHPPLLQSEDADGRTWLRRSCDFTGKEGDDMLATWIIDCVRNRILPPREKLKYGFYLVPHETSSLERFTSGKLNAPRIFRIHKVIEYVIKGLKLDNGDAEGDAPDIEILCNDQILPTMMSLATVKQYIWRKSDDIILHFRKRATVDDAVDSDAKEDAHMQQQPVGRVQRKAFSPLGC